MASEGSAHRVLLLAPEDGDRRALHLALEGAGARVAAVDDLELAERYLEANTCEAIFAAIPLVEAARRCKLPVVAIARPGEVATPARAAMLIDLGATDIIPYATDVTTLSLALVRAGRAPRGSAAIDRPVASPSAAMLIGEGPAMARLRAMIEQIAPTSSTVLVLGESGTGKELVARAIHELSPRRARRFIAVNCAAIPAALIESELFGHVRGAFTDAVRDKAGLFEDADGGTLFLDEIGELPHALQAKLLRVLQSREVRRVGDSASTRVDVRLVAATLRDLTEDVAAGRFRDDLFYRLAVLPIRLPPLRERREDIPGLARFFTARHAGRHGLRGVELAQPVLDLLARQPWPGNVRELENVLERALVLSESPVITPEFLATVMTVVEPAPDTDTPLDGPALSIKKATRELEADLIRRALSVTQGNRTNAAKLLEISHRALLYKLKEYGIA